MNDSRTPPSGNDGPDIEAKVDALSDSMARGFARADERLDSIDGGFERVDERFDAIDQRFVQVDQRFDAVDQRFARVDERFDAVDQRFDGLEQQIKIQTEALREDIQKAAEGYAATLEQISRDLSGVRDSLSTKLGDHESALKDHARRLDVLEKR